MSTDESKKEIKEDKQSGSLRCDYCGQIFDTDESVFIHSS